MFAAVGAGVTSAALARKDEGRAGATVSSTGVAIGVASNRAGETVRTTAHSGNTSVRTGSASVVKRASVHTRCRVAADAGRRITPCASAATPSNTETLTTIQTAAEIMAHLLVREPVS